MINPSLTPSFCLKVQLQYTSTIEQSRAKIDGMQGYLNIKEK